MEQPDFANSTLREQLDALGREADSLELNFDCDRCRSFLQKLRELRIPRNTRSAHIIEFFALLFRRTTGPQLERYCRLTPTKKALCQHDRARSLFFI